MSRTRLYLDHAATTPLLPAAREAMADALARWHNPSSPHAEGRAARAALEQARTRIAAALGWPGPVLFTSGASEALTIALQRGRAGERIISAVEHDALLRAAPTARRLAVGSDGIVDLAHLSAVAGAQPLVAVQHANNEAGVLQPLEQVAEAVRAKGGILLADCAQTAGKLPLPDADMIALSAHKFGGPPGAGALLLRDWALIEPVGGQEQGYRYGTENLPAILGMAAALDASEPWIDRAAALRARLEEAIAATGGTCVAAGSARIPTIGAYRMPGVAAAAQLIEFDMAGIAVSAGSACSSGSLKPSHVLAAMGWEEPALSEVIRVSFGPATDAADVDRFAALWARLAARRRAA
ncbi:cysteine desulfurase family protein [Sphingomonas sp.]|uniref:cysteine desulfurase family protein n=1 Tax=Sphingomonas sp. TaxID=28214 RepID=UPI002FCB9D3A